MSEDYKRVKGLKRIGNSIAHGLYMVGSEKMRKELDKVENTEIKNSALRLVDVADDLAIILTDDNAENRKQIESYLKDTAKRDNMLDLGLTIISAVAHEKLSDEELDTLKLNLGILSQKLNSEVSREA